MTTAPTDNTAKWAALRAPFDTDEIELLPRYTGKKEDKGKNKKSCPECKGYHDFPCIHLSYIGHAGITIRLNEIDPEWSWEPMARDDHGMPLFDAYGGLWAWMTVLGVTKPAYGDPGTGWDGKPKRSTDGQKEAIGDMIRNGAMRFGAGTQLWSKSDKAKNDLLKQGVDDDPAPAPQTPANPNPPEPVEATGWAAVVESYKQHDTKAKVLDFLGMEALDTAEQAKEAAAKWKALSKPKQAILALIAVGADPNAGK